MRVVGVVALIALGVVVLAMLGLVVASIPDLNRYRRLRKM